MKGAPPRGRWRKFIRTRYHPAMIQLTPHECRVLGVLIEKAQTTAAQYPLSLNALITGCNQKSNREPVITIDEDEALDALDGLRAKHLIHEVMLTDSRVRKFRHVARDGLDLGTRELVILAEMLMRGPQTIGELRGRASRMHPLESTDMVKNILDQLMELDEPLVRKLAPAPGSRAPRYAQLFCPELHPVDVPAAAPARGAATPPSAEFEPRLARLEVEVAELRQALTAITQALGEPSLMRGTD